MKAKAVVDFGLQFGVKISFNEDMIVEQDGRFYLLNSKIKPLVKEDFFYAGTFLGKVKAGKFFPSFNLLSMLALQGANRVVVDRKAGWLFICRRDIFKKGVIRAHGQVQRNCHVLVVNEFGECLGFGRVMAGMEQKAGKGVVAVANVLDLGDFLRRERGL
ncbi:MAG: PUA domain-containing protein [Candidatus Bathyarchaeia archaeon]|jgi:ribosome biogenesis protein Nip4